MKAAELKDLALEELTRRAGEIAPVRSTRPRT
jgi:hypothetical protein